MGKTTIMIADDHALVRAGLKMLLQRKPEYELIGEAADGLAAVALYSQLRPDILLLDISLPRLDGREVLAGIKRCYPEAKVIILTMHEDEGYVKAVMQAGAAGYVPKSAVDDELITALEIVAQGCVYLRQQQASCLRERTADELSPKNPLFLLSSREREVFNLLINGYSMADIGRMLSLSPKTINTHKERIMLKLNVSKKNELVEFAIRAGLIR